MRNYLVVGPPGSGKTTQAAKLAGNLGLPHIQAGDLLYYVSQEKTVRGRMVKKAMAKGLLVADPTTLAIINEQLEKKQYRQGFVLDGFPRKLSQARLFKIKFNQVFSLKVSDQVNLARLLKRGRRDDQKKLIEKRLKVYHQETEPMLAFYQKKGLLKEVNGEQTIEAIHQEILKQLEK